MKILIVLCSLALLLTSSLVMEAQQAPDNAPSASEMELLSLTKAWTDAINAKDRLKLDELMAPEFTLHAMGQLVASSKNGLDVKNLFDVNDLTASGHLQKLVLYRKCFGRWRFAAEAG